eukprot:SAG11_NODE_14056_length_627_cov_0.875000_2_plen_45_part_01
MSSVQNSNSKLRSNLRRYKLKIKSETKPEHIQAGRQAGRRPQVTV